MGTTARATANTRISAEEEPAGVSTGSGQPPRQGHRPMKELSMDKGSSDLRIAQQIAVQGDAGVKVQIDLNEIVASDEQKQALNELFKTGKLSSLTTDQRELIKDLKAWLKAGPGPQALIVRFDWKWVRIDERFDMGGDIRE